MQGTLVKKGNSWHVKYYEGKDANGKPKQRWRKLNATTEREADRERDRLMVALESPDYVEPTKMTIAQFLDTWMAEYVEPSLCLKTARWYRMNCNYHIKPRIGGLPVGKVSPLNIIKMLNEIDGKDTTLKGVYATIRAALNKAVEWQFIAKNPADFVKPPRVERREYQTLSFEGVKQFLGVASECRNYGVYLTALTTGMRLEEILGIRWQDVNFEKRIINVKWQLVKGGDKPQWGKTKGKKERPVPMTEMLHDELKRIQHRQKVERMKAGEQWEEYGLVFTTAHRYYGRPLDGHNLSRREFKKLLDKAFPDEKGSSTIDMRFHDLRHSVATLLLGCGVEIKVVSEILGHTSQAITEAVYLHPDAEFKRPAIERLEAALRR